MFGSELIEVIIAIVGLYILLSIVCSAIREIIEVFQRSKSYHLHRMIVDLLVEKDDKDISDGSNQSMICHFYNHPEIFCLFKGKSSLEKIKRVTQNRWRLGGDLPSYIPARNFANAILDMAVRGTDTNDHNTSASTPALNLLNARNSISNIPSARLRRAILLAIDLADGDYNKAISNLERWYDTATQRVSEQYKRQTSKIILVVALFISGILNINTINLIDYIYRQDSANNIVKQSAVTTPPDISQVATASNSVDIPRVPLGWSIGWAEIKASLTSNGQFKWLKLFSNIAGILLTAFAASLGAPFWFDLLSRIAQLRSSIPPREAYVSNEEKQNGQLSIPQTSSPGSGSTPVGSTDGDDEYEEGFDGVVVVETKDKDLPKTLGGVK